MVSSALRARLDAERDRLLAFGRGARSPLGGFGHLDTRGRLVPDAPIRTFQTCRMTYCFVLSVLLGNDADRNLIRGGLRALQEELHDHENGGWYDTLNCDGTPKVDSKAAYGHAFVLLAAASATAVGEPAATELLREVRAVIDDRFWDDATGVMRESYDAAWTTREAYCGANANMHAVEAFLVTADATGDVEYLDRAERIALTFIDGFARECNWRLPEHYSADLEVLPEYNRRNPLHHFRPYGVTPGHLLEWARLCIQLSGSLRAASAVDDWHLEAARELYERAVGDGWGADGRAGFVYTVDFDGRFVARTRMSWVLAEAISAAAALHEATGESRYAADVERWWDAAQRFFVDRADGSWHHALDETNTPDPTVWGGKPDIYHTLQALLFPGRSMTPSLPFVVLGAARKSKSWTESI